MEPLYEKIESKNYIVAPQEISPQYIPQNIKKENNYHYSPTIPESTIKTSYYNQKLPNLEIYKTYIDAINNFPVEEIKYITPNLYAIKNSTKIPYPEQLSNDSLFEQIVADKLSAREKQEYDPHANRASLVADVNAAAQEHRISFGLEDHSGITIEVGDHEGRTDLRTFLDGMSDGRFIIPRSNWQLSQGEYEHDLQAHFGIIERMHPDTAAVLITHASKGILYLAAGDELGAKEVATDLDLALSYDLKGVYPSYIRRICWAQFEHLQYSGVITDPDAGSYAQRVLAQQMEFNRFVDERKAAIGIKDSGLLTTSELVDVVLLPNNPGNKLANNLSLSSL